MIVLRVYLIYPPLIVYVFTAAILASYAEQASSALASGSTAPFRIYQQPCTPSLAPRPTFLVGEAVACANSYYCVDGRWVHIVGELLCQPLRH